MKKKTIISLFSTLVFIFPLIYQPLHVFLHHGDHHEKVSGYSTKEEKCLAYEYQFASFDLPEQIHLNFDSFNHNSELNTFYKKSDFDLKLFHSSSRAPPAYS